MRWNVSLVPLRLRWTGPACGFACGIRFPFSRLLTLLSFCLRKKRLHAARTSSHALFLLAVPRSRPWLDSPRCTRLQSRRLQSRHFCIPALLLLLAVELTGNALAGALADRKSHV